MKIDHTTAIDMNIALNEADIINIEFDEERNLVACTFDFWPSGQNKKKSADNRLLFVFKTIGRFVTSIRKKDRDGAYTLVEYCEPEDFSKILDQFCVSSIYGWKFINCDESAYSRWMDKLSFDYRSDENTGLDNNIYLFLDMYMYPEDGTNKIVDIRIWFDELEIFTPAYKRISIQQFIHSGKSSWKEFNTTNGVRIKKTLSRDSSIPIKHSLSIWDKLKNIF